MILYEAAELLSMTGAGVIFEADGYVPGGTLVEYGSTR